MLARSVATGQVHDCPVWLEEKIEKNEKFENDIEKSGEWRADAHVQHSSTRRHLVQEMRQTRHCLKETDDLGGAGGATELCRDPEVDAGGCPRRHAEVVLPFASVPPRLLAERRVTLNNGFALVA